MRYLPAHAARWRNPKIKALSPHGKLLFDYLTSNHYTTSSGIYPLDLATATEETGIPAEQIRFALGELCTIHERVTDHKRAPLIRYDGFVVWVVGQWKHAVNQSWPHQVQVGFEFNRSYSLPYWKDFFELYPGVRKTLERMKRFSGREAFLANIDAARPGPPNALPANAANGLFPTGTEGPTTGAYPRPLSKSANAEKSGDPKTVSPKEDKTSNSNNDNGNIGAYGRGLPYPPQHRGEERRSPLPSSPPPEDAPTLEIFGKTLQVGESVTTPVKVRGRPATGPSPGPPPAAEADDPGPWGKILDAKTGELHDNPKVKEDDLDSPPTFPIPMKVDPEPDERAYIPKPKTISEPARDKRRKKLFATRLDKLSMDQLRGQITELIEAKIDGVIDQEELAQFKSNVADAMTVLEEKEAKT